MSGLSNITKIFGQVTISANGKKVVWLYDYANDKPRLKSEMTKEEIKASEKAKWELLRTIKQKEKNKQNVIQF